MPDVFLTLDLPGDPIELSGKVYGRLLVPANSVGSVTDYTNGWTLTTAEVTFTASGGPWNLAQTKFLATTADPLLIAVPDSSGTCVSSSLHPGLFLHSRFPPSRRHKPYQHLIFLPISRVAPHGGRVSQLPQPRLKSARQLLPCRAS